MGSVLLDVLVLLAAYGVTVGIALALLFLTFATAPRMLSRSNDPHPRLLVLNALIWLLAAAAGGAIIAYLAQFYPLFVALAFACLLFAAIFSVASEGIGKTSLNYEVAVAACASAGAMLGCLAMQFYHLHVHILL
ncbi:MAG: hypothetical protein P4L10_12730 [Acidobacteriaceae bacterium]|jgi:hypothetical protein|nr:hypothetical protein [Acidobacteriaceae bacterium]